MMLTLLLYLFIFFLAIIQSSLLAINFDIIILVVWLLVRTATEAEDLRFPFWLGIIFDLILVRPLGLASLIFVTLAFVMGVYLKRLDLGKRYFLLIFLPLMSFCLSKIFGKSFTIGQALLEIFLGWWLWPVMKYFFEEEVIGRQLKLRI